MGRFTTLATLLCIWGFVNGCGFFESGLRIRETKDRQVSVLDNSSNRRAAYIIHSCNAEGNPTTRPIIFGEPPPDTALEATAKLVGELTRSSAFSGKVDGALTTSIVDLTKRTQAIVILRDSLYRLAEERANGRLTDQQYLYSFTQVLSVAKEIALAEKERQTARLEAEKVKALTLDQINKIPDPTKRTDLLQKFIRGSDGSEPP